MNIAVGIWQPEGVELNLDRIITQWQTRDWQGTCHSVQFFVASEEPVNARKAPPGVTSIEFINRKPLIEEVVSQFQDHWVDHWFNKYKDFLAFAGILASPLEMNEFEENCEIWLKDWLKFWSAQQVIQRHWTTYYGDEPMDVVFLTDHDFFFEPNSRAVGEMYAQMADWPLHKAGRTAAYRYPPLNGAAQVVRHDQEGRTVLLGGQNHTLSQLLNPKNIRLYFCEHFQPLQSSMPLDLDPLNCIARLMELSWEKFKI